MLLLTHGDIKYNPGPKKKLTIFSHVATAKPNVSWHEANFIY